MQLYELFYVTPHYTTFQQKSKLTKQEGNPVTNSVRFQTRVNLPKPSFYSYNQKICNFHARMLQNLHIHLPAGAIHTSTPRTTPQQNKKQQRFDLEYEIRHQKIFLLQPDDIPFFTHHSFGLFAYSSSNIGNLRTKPRERSGKQSRKISHLENMKNHNLDKIRPSDLSLGMQFYTRVCFEKTYFFFRRGHYEKNSTME